MKIILDYHILFSIGIGFCIDAIIGDAQMDAPSCARNGMVYFQAGRDCDENRILPQRLFGKGGASVACDGSPVDRRKRTSFMDFPYRVHPCFGTSFGRAFCVLSALAKGPESRK